MVHDTYYVVAHFHYILSLVVATVVVFAVWYAILRFSDPSPKRLARITLAAFLVGALFAIAPSLFLSLTVPSALHNSKDPEAIARWFRIANRTAAIGAALTSVAVLLTVATMVRALFLWLRHRTGR